MRAARLALLAFAALLVLPATAQARSLGLALISKGLKNPLFVTTAPGDSSRCRTRACPAPRSAALLRVRPHRRWL